MLPKKSRIQRKLFAILLESRSFFHSDHFILRTAPASEVKVAVSVSKKISKKASVRNTVRRRAYAALSPILKELSPKLYFFSAKPGSETLQGEALRLELAKLIKKS